MYTGVIPRVNDVKFLGNCIPRVYGGDPHGVRPHYWLISVLPVYTGVIPRVNDVKFLGNCIPRVYGGDPHGVRPHYWLISVLPVYTGVILQQAFEII